MFKKYILCALCLLPLVAGSAFASQRVSAIRIEGLSRVDEASVQAVLTTKVGQDYSAAGVDKDVRAIYALGHFKDIEVDSEDADGTVVLKYIVMERPLIRKIRIDGNKELKNSKVRSALTIRTPSILNPKTLQESVAAIKQLYVDDGFYAVAVDTKVKNT